MTQFATLDGTDESARAKRNLYLGFVFTVFAYAFLAVLVGFLWWVINFTEGDCGLLIGALVAICYPVIYLAFGFGLFHALRGFLKSEQTPSIRDALLLLAASAGTLLCTYFLVIW